MKLTRTSWVKWCVVVLPSQNNATYSLSWAKRHSVLPRDDDDYGWSAIPHCTRSRFKTKIHSRGTGREGFSQNTKGGGEQPSRLHRSLKNNNTITIRYLLAVVTTDEWPPQAAKELLCTRHSRNGNWKASSSSRRESSTIRRSFCDFTLGRRIRIIELPHFTTDNHLSSFASSFPQKSWQSNRNSRSYRAIKERLYEWIWYEAESVLIAIQVVLLQEKSQPRKSNFEDEVERGVELDGWMDIVGCRFGKATGVIQLYSNLITYRLETASSAGFITN